MYKKIIFAFTIITIITFGTAFAQTAGNFTANSLEQRVFELINNERTNNGLTPYIWHNTLASITRAHSEDMLRNNFFGFTGSNGQNNSQRLRQGGITNIGGENTLLAAGGSTPEQQVATWMNSSRSVILSENRTHIGIGIVQRPAGTNAAYSAYWTLTVIDVPLELTSSDIRAFELRVLELTNIERANQGLPPLVWHETLAEAARRHSEDMMRTNRLSHTGSDGSTVTQRIERAGITNWRYNAENVAQGQRTPEEVVDSWMRSPGHRANILNTTSTHLGVGFVQRLEGSNADFGFYWTQKFCAFR